MSAEKLLPSTVASIRYDCRQARVYLRHSGDTAAAVAVEHCLRAIELLVAGLCPAAPARKDPEDEHR